MQCGVCHKRLMTAKAIGAGMGEVCRKRLLSGEAKISTRPKVRLLGRYRDGSRSWLVFTEPRVVVRITPVDEEMESYQCDFGGTCQDANCVHKEAVRAAESELEARRRAA